MVNPVRILVVTALSLCLAVAVLGACIWWAQVAATFLGRRNLWDAGDFATLYSAGYLVLHGQPHSIYNLDALTAIRNTGTTVGGGDRIAYLNPPFFAPLFAPFALLSYDRAYQLWAAIGLAFTAVTCWLIWRTTDTLPRWQRAVMIAALLTAYPLTMAVRLGQFSMILMTSWTAAYTLLRGGRDRAAGLALAPMLIKPELLIPVAALLVWKRRYGVFSTLLPITVLAAAASFAVVGPAGGLRYPLLLLDNARNSTNGTHTDFMFGWNGWLGAFLDPHQPLRTTLLSLPLTAVTLAATAFVWRAPLLPQSRRFPRQWLALTLASVLVDPNFFMQDLVIVFPAAFALVAACEGRQRVAVAVIVAVGWAVCGLGLDPGAHWHFNIVSTLIIASFAAIVWYEARRPHAASLRATHGHPLAAGGDIAAAGVAVIDERAA